MGMLMKQSDPITGVYPLWDNSDLPLNVLEQAWLVNDLGLGAVATFYIKQHICVYSYSTLRKSRIGR